jgi:hypothetical protein
VLDGGFLKLVKVLFLDESGDHSLSKIDPQYPMFVLGGVIVDQEYAEGKMTRRVEDLKRSFFGRTDIVLHTADLVRNRNGFECMKETSCREAFYQALNSLMRELDYKVVACAIRKDEHIKKYNISALDPYFLALEILVERFAFEVGKGKGIIVAESRGPTLDNQLEIAWLNLKIQGTRFLRPTKLVKRISGLSLRDKNSRIAGLELADLVVSPIGRSILGKNPKEDYRIIEGKFRRDATGNHLGPGLIILPKKERGQDPLRSSQPT